MEGLNTIQILEQLGIGLGLAVIVSWLFYKSLATRIRILEGIISNHDKRESIHIRFIEKLISIIPANKKSSLDVALKQYHEELKNVDLTKSK